MGDRDLILPGVIGVVVIMAGLLGVRSLAEAQQDEKARTEQERPALERPATPRQ